MNRTLIVCLGLLALTRTAEASTISIGSDGTTASPFGEPDTATYGQTFIATDAVLDQFSFWLDDQSGAVDFAGYVMAWNSVLHHAFGPVLYAGNMRTTTNNNGAGGFERFDFFTGGLALSAGAQYVAFLSASNFFDGTSTFASIPLDQTDAYAKGAFVLFNNGSDFGALTTSAWLSIPLVDARFFASFSEAETLPEPSTLLLLLIGGAGAIARVRRPRSSLLRDLTTAG